MTFKRVIDLKGPQGNAFYLIGLAKELCPQTNLNYGEVLLEMTSRDYDNLVETFESFFSDFVILER